MTRVTRVRRLASVLAAALAVGTSLSFAAESRDANSPERSTQTSVVRFNDLDLSGIEGTVALYGRLQRAAHEV